MDTDVESASPNGGPRNRVVVLGAGPGGLASALRLSAAGASVTVLEAQERVGGRSAALEVDGFRFDRGPTFFLYPRPLERLLAESGYDLGAECELIRLDPMYRVAFGAGGHLDATGDVSRMAREVARLSPQDAFSLNRWMEENRAKLALFRKVLEKPFLSWASLLDLDLLRALPLLRPLRSLDADLQRCFEDPRVRLAFSFQSKYLGMSPYRCPSLFSILSFLEYEFGVFHPRGGCSAVVETLARLAAEQGARIQLSEPAQEILFEGRRAVAVRTARGTYPCDALVINADFAHAMRSLVPDRLRRRWSDAALERKKFSCSTFMLYLGLEGLYADLPHHTIHIAEDYAKNLADIEERHALSDDPSFYVQNACVTDPSLAPRGHSTLYVLAPVTHQTDGLDWSREAPRFREVVLRQLERKLSLHDLRGRIRVERQVTPADWERMGIYRGATFNLAHSLDQMLHLRPRNRFEDLEGVYLVGGGTHPGSGLPVIFESARISSALVREDLGLSDAPLRPRERARLTEAEGAP
jgi:phytoene desaturase